MIELTKIGTLRKTVGTQGTIRVEISTRILPILNKRKFIFIDIKGTKIPFRIKELKIDPSITIKLEEYTDPQMISEFTNRDIYIESYLIPEELLQNQDDNSLNKIIGFKVYLVDNQYLGEVVEIVDYGNHTNVLIEKNDVRKEVPFHDDLIIDINEEKKNIILDLPIGL